MSTGEILFVKNQDLSGDMGVGVSKFLDFTVDNIRFWGDTYW